MEVLTLQTRVYYPDGSINIQTRVYYPDGSSITLTLKNEYITQMEVLTLQTRVYYPD